MYVCVNIILKYAKMTKIMQVNVSLSFLLKKNINNTFGSRSLENHLWNVHAYSYKPLVFLKKAVLKYKKRDLCQWRKLNFMKQRKLEKEGAKLLLKKLLFLCSYYAHKIKFNFCYGRTVSFPFIWIGYHSRYLYIAIHFVSFSVESPWCD